MRSTNGSKALQIDIVGAGLVGRLLGWRLTKQGYSVRLFERRSSRDPRCSSYVAAAMLAPLSEFPDCEPAIWELAKTSLRLWPSWLEELEVPYRMDGSIAIAHVHDQPLLQKFSRVLTKGGLQDQVQELDSSALQVAEPEIAKQFIKGLLLQGEGWLDNRQLMKSLESRCGEIEYETEADPQSLHADVVIDCRGFGAEDQELRGVRGEIVRVQADEVNLTRPIRLMHPKYQLYIAPRPDNEYVIGATQIESDSESPMTVRSALELLSAAYTVHPGFAEASILELGVGVRPAFPDNLPRVRWLDGVLQVNGLYRHGYLVGPATIEAAMEEVESVCRYTSTAI